MYIYIYICIYEYIRVYICIHICHSLANHVCCVCWHSSNYVYVYVYIHIYIFVCWRKLATQFTIENHKKSWLMTCFINLMQTHESTATHVAGEARMSTSCDESEPALRVLQPFAGQVELQHTATHCNTLQQHCNSTVCSKFAGQAEVQHTAIHRNTLQHTATHCNTLQHSATLCNSLQHTSTHCSTL